MNYNEQKNNHICRTCGKEYFCCEASERQGGYKAVACSYECYQAYMRAVLSDRGEPIPDEFKENKNTKKEKVVSNVKVDDKDIEMAVVDEKEEVKVKESKKDKVDVK